MNIAVAQSGGPTAAINSSLCGVFSRAVKAHGIERVYGSLCGIEGIIYDNLICLNDKLKTDEDIERLMLTPSTALGSCRYKLPDRMKDDAPYRAVAKCFEKYDIGMFFYIGGNDSMDTVAKLSAYFKKSGSDVKIIGIPKTIDNDLCETDHTPGFGSAAKYLAATMREIVRDSSVYSAKSVTIVEIMGRNAGWLTASSCIVRLTGETAPHLIYLPEREFKIDRFIHDVKLKLKEHRAVIVAVSEGVEIQADNYDLSDFQSGATDNFGHKYLSGVGKCLEKVVSNEIGCKVRSIELNVLQRCSAHLASKTDLDEAFDIGAAAVDAACAGETGKMMTIQRLSDKPYAVSMGSVPADIIANEVKLFPDKWINADSNDVLPEAVDYFLPLILGEPDIKYENGMPVQMLIK